MLDSEGAEGARDTAVPPLQFNRDPNLPIFARRDDIIQALERTQVLIVAGDTGSGKSTQLPQYCLEMKRGSSGLIAHTQPRRLAARALAARIAEELGQAVGATVGFRVRFADRVSAATRLILMTDGLLLAELNNDPLLRRYDTIIVDEAHERTLNVDLLLGVLKRILPRRPDLKLLVTSATLEVERMSRFFNDAPIIAVSGRSHPIEMRYRRADDDTEDPDLPLEVLEAYREIAGEPGQIGSGDVLVFLPGEREIGDVGELLERELKGRVDILSLYSRMSWEQQSKIFQRGPRQRIVLSTNVAETSVTVPGIRAVIDSGLARISRYSVRNRLQRLPIESISRASADQRKGRCGRLGAGLCMRLYTEEDFDSRPLFTEPEVLRTNLAALLLRLAADGLGAAEDFPFIDAPDSRALNDGYRLLQELQALEENRRITPRGRAMARLPIDPRLGRALLESKRFHAQRELLAIVAGLSVPDVRVGEAPVSAAAFEDSKSEFSALYKLWTAYRKAREGSRRELRRWCKERHFSLLRLSEWDDVYTQVVERARDIGITAEQRPASYTSVHRSLLAGFSTMVGTRGEDGAYTGTRGVQFHIFPGSPLARRRPRWVMAASIVETSRVFARRVAEVEPMWIEAAATHLLKREYLEPDWDEAREEVIARERISFLGLTLSANRIVNYGPIAPEESRRIFAREALVYRRLQRRPDWLRVNDAAIHTAQQMEERLRTRDLLRSAEDFVEFYDQGLPRQVSSAATLEHFSRHLSPEQEAALLLTPARIFARQPAAEALAQFPETTRIDELLVPVEYRFVPGEAQDGASLNVPLLALPGLSRAMLDAAIPGLSLPRIEALLRSLPKEARRHLIPIADTAAKFLAQSATAAADAAHLSVWLREQRAMAAASIRFDLTAVPAHLTVQLMVTNGEKVLARGTDLADLRRRCAAAGRAELEHRARTAYAALGNWRDFAIEELPDRVELQLEQGGVTVYPVLARRGAELQLSYEWTQREAEQLWRDTSVRLARVVLARQARDHAKSLGGTLPLLVRASPYGNSTDLVDALLQIAFRKSCFGDSAAPRTRTAYDAAVDRGRERLYECLEETSATALSWFTEAASLRRALEDPRASKLPHAAEETRQHLRALLDCKTLPEVSADWLRQLPRYLKAEQRRWERNAVRGGEPAHVAAELEYWSARYRALAAKIQAEQRFLAQLEELRFWIEEYRVSLYAQELKTLGPVSAARLAQRAAEIEAWIQR
jgi:ATP-dependent helicase HrpA